MTHYDIFKQLFAHNENAGNLCASEVAHNQKKAVEAA